MKRKTTNLEQRLIENGFSLSHKTYKGKDKKRTEFYVYKGTLDNYTIRVYLDYKREKLDHYVIENTLPSLIVRENLDALERVYEHIFEMLYEHKEDTNE